MEIKQKLEQIGLSGKKVDVYLAILQLGKASVLQIAKKAGIKRPTTYDILEDLIAKKLVNQTFIGKKKIFVAEDPANLKLMLKKQEEDIEGFLPELNSIFNLTARKPKIRYFEGNEGVRQIYEEILKNQPKEFFYFGSIKEMTEVLGSDYMDNWVKRRIKAGIVSHAIRIKSKEKAIKEWQGDKKYLRDLKFFPLDIKEDFSHLIIYDNNVIIISALAESYGLVIESKELAATLKYIWKVVWQASRR